MARCSKCRCKSRKEGVSSNGERFMRQLRKDVPNEPLVYKTSEYAAREGQTAARVACRSSLASARRRYLFERARGVRRRERSTCADALSSAAGENTPRCASTPQPGFYGRTNDNQNVAYHRVTPRRTAFFWAGGREGSMSAP